MTAVKIKLTGRIMFPLPRFWIILDGGVKSKFGIDVYTLCL